MTIRLNGDPYDVPGPITVLGLLTHLQIDHRRVAVELNLTVLKRAVFDSTPIHEGDEVEIVNFVGGGSNESSDGGSPEGANGGSGSNTSSAENLRTNPNPRSHPRSNPRANPRSNY